MTTRRFPNDFLWGTATASFQVEGAADADGRGPSIWDTFCRKPGAVRNGDNGDVACDHYHRVDEDLDLVKRLGVGSYRFSVAWPRIQPTGKGPANQPGLDFYRRLVDGLVARGVEATITLYHWDLPQALQDDGGWVVRDTAERFAEYADIVARAIGDGAARWITLNEPWCSAWRGYEVGDHAPGITDVGQAAAAHHHLLLAHGLATQALRAVVPEVPVGISLNLAAVRPGSDDAADVAAAQRKDGNHNRLFLDPLFKATYPGDMLEHYAKGEPGFSVVRDGDLATIAQPLDFLGVNYYAPEIIVDASRRQAARELGYTVPTRPESHDLKAVGVQSPGAQVTQMNWEVDASGLRDILVRVGREYTDIPLYVTENGAAYDDYVGPTGEVRDEQRIEYVSAHLGAVLDAIGDGVDVKGYFYWSVMDNFEWAFGYSRRFGLVWVDYPTGTRLPKRSYDWYAEMIARNSL
jgi:beta-glucosidase